MNNSLFCFNFFCGLQACKNLQNAQLIAFNGLHPERVIVTKSSEDEKKAWDYLSSLHGFNFQAA